MTGELSKDFHGVDIGPLSKILAVNAKAQDFQFENARATLSTRAWSNGRAVNTEGAGRQLFSLLDFGRSVNPISSKGGRLCPPHYE